MPINLVKSTIAGEVGMWGPDVNNNWDAITAWVAAEEAARVAGEAARPTFAQMTTAIANQSLLAF